jgi:creatinine amidohydrolase
MDLADLAWPAVAAMPKDTPIVFPIAALDSHGRQLPLFIEGQLL